MFVVYCLLFVVYCFADARLHVTFPIPNSQFLISYFLFLILYSLFLILYSLFLISYSPTPHSLASQHIAASAEAPNSSSRL
jgi:hypothetical protein